MQFSIIQLGNIQAIFDIQEEGIFCSLKNRTTQKFELPFQISNADLEKQPKEHDFYFPLPLSQVVTLVRACEGKIFSEEELVINNKKYQKINERIYAQLGDSQVIDIYVEQNTFCGIIIPTAQLTTYFIKTGAFATNFCDQWFADMQLPREHHAIAEILEERVTITEDISLATTIILPQTNLKKVPTLLARTPYGRQQLLPLYRLYVEHGYAVVLQDVRGRNDSDGEIYIPKIYEKEDGEKTLNWIASQPWSNGLVGMIGASYLGYVQWAAAASGNEHFKALVSIVTAGSAFKDLPRKGGTFSSGGFALGFGLARKKFNSDRLVRGDWDKLLAIRPIQNIAQVGLGHTIPYIDLQLKHPTNDFFWRAMDWHQYGENMRASAMVVSGWYDDNQGGSLEALEIITSRQKKGFEDKVIFGPWLHNGNRRREVGGVHLGGNAIRYDLDQLQIRYLHHFLKDESYSIQNIKILNYFTVGANKWETSDEIPCDKIIEQEYFLQAGLLKVEKTDRYEKNTYHYDPQNPAPQLIDVSENELSVPADYAAIAKREDVLVYQTFDLAEKRPTITGIFRAVLYLSADVVDTDIVIRLCEKTKQGQYFLMASGFLTLKYREGYEKEVYLEKDKIYEVHISTNMISQQLQKGSELALLITSSAKEYIFPHSNTKAAFNTNEYVVGQINIHTNGQTKSKIIVPFEKA